MKPARSTLELPWGSVSYVEWRRDRAPRSTVVLLHGGGVDNAELSWGGLAPDLAAAGHRVIAPDHPGFGKSPEAPWPMTQERLVAYVGEVVEALGLDRYVVGGLSLGGGMAIGHVLARPGHVDGVLLLGSYGLMDRQFDGRLAVPAHLLTSVALHSGMLGILQRAYGRNRRLMDSSLRSIVRNPEARTADLLDQVWAAARRPGCFAAFEQWQRDQLGWRTLRTNYIAWLGEITVPALIVHGERDTGVPVARAREAARRMPDARLLVVPAAGHWVQRDRPDIVTPAILGFLDDLCSATSADAT